MFNDSICTGRKTGQRVSDNPVASEPDDGLRRHQRIGGLADVGCGRLVAAEIDTGDASVSTADARFVVAAVVHSVLLQDPAFEIAGERRERAHQSRRSLQVDKENNGGDSELQLREIVAGTRFDISGLGHIADITRLGRQEQGRRETLPAGGDPAEDRGQHALRRREHGHVADGTNRASHHVIHFNFISPSINLR